MMWSTAILLLLAGAAFAEPQNGWKDGKEYTYKIRSRTLASFNQQSKQFTGILIEGNLKVQPNGPNTLRAKIEQPRYSQIHTRLDNGWESEIPREQLNMQNFPLTSQPFEIKTKNGVVQDLVVDKDLPTWEVNVIKSFVSQLQVDTQGENALNSMHNQFPENDQPFGLYKTMEDSVSGKCEVLYDISPMPEKVLKNKPELAPLPELREDGDMISIVKTKNYSNCDQRVSFHFGVDRRNKWEPGSNDNSAYLSRSTVSRVVLSGKLRKYTIQSSVTVNKVMHSADKQENEQGMVASKTELTLREVNDISEQMPSPSNPQSTGNLVYNYNNPFDSNTSRRQNKLGQNNRSNQEQQRNRQNQNRNNANEDRDSDESSSSDSSDSLYDNDDDSYLQPRPKLTEAPRNPMLPFFVGNYGNNIQKNNKIDAVKSAKDIAQQIGNEMQKPDTMPEEQTLEKFTILTRLVRTMNAEQIAEVQRELYQQRESANQLNQNGQGQNARRNAWVAFRDAVAQAGTGPALVNVKQWIQNKQIQGNEAAGVVDSVAKSARTPTPEYMDAYFEMAMQQQTKEQPAVRDSAILAFADLIRYAIVDRQSVHNRYPVHAFGRLFPKKNRDLHEKYFPRMAEELQKAIDNGDSKVIQVYANAIGRTAHTRVLSVFEPYLEGRKQVSPFQRLVMVLSLNKIAEIHPKTAQSVLYKIYANTDDYYEIRTAAVYLLMKTNPPASMLQRMADFTNYDSNKHVNSAVKSTIESLARLDNNDNENRELINAAKAAQPLLTTKNFRLQHSRSAYLKFTNPFTQSGLYFQANYIGSDDSIVPKGVYVTTSPTFKGIQLSNVEVGGAVSSVRNLWNFAQEQLLRNSKNSNNYNNNAKIQKAQEQKYSPENIAKMLGIHGEDPQQVEGFLFGNGKLGNYFLSYDNRSLENIPEQMKWIAEEMKRGKGYEDARLNNDEVTISFPTETGFPFSFVLKSPTIMSINGLSKLKTESDSENQSGMPKSVTVSGKVRIVMAMEVQKRLGFVTPFEHQQYVVGIDKNVQVHLPIRGEINYDSSKQETRMNLQPNEDIPEFKVLQYKTQPFTSKHDILNLEPISKDKNTHIIHKDRTTKSQMELNDENNKQRVQFNWERQTWQSAEQNQNHETKKRNDMESLNKLATSIASLYYPNNVDAEYQKYSVKVNPGSDMNAEMRVSYDSLRTENDNNAQDYESHQVNGKAPRLDRSLSEGERKEKLMREAAKNINSAKAQAIDISLKLNGPAQSSLSLTGAIGKSEVDQKSRGLFYARAETKEGKNYFLSAGLEKKKPNVNSLDYEENLKANTGAQFDAEIRFGKGNEENSQNDQNRIKIRGEAQQTEERKNQIRQSRDAQACIKDERQNGNKMSRACQEVNQRTQRVNVGDITVTFENEAPLETIAMRVLDSAEHLAGWVAETQKDRQDKSEKNKIKIHYELSPNDEQVDVIVKSPEGKLQFNNINLNRNSNGNNGNVKDNQNENNPDEEMFKNNVCNLDKTQAKTFDNKRYSLKLGQCWHVAMTTYPKNNADNPSQQLQIPENMHATILVKENEDGQKELKITLGEKEIKLSASAPRQVNAKVNGEKVELHHEKSYQGKQDNKIAFEIFKLSDNSVKLTSDKYDMEIVYDGVRAQIEAGNKYRNSVRGLCGNNDGESENDQKTPKGCLLRKPEEFSATYALVNDGQCQGPAMDNAEKAKNSDCTYDSVRPGNVISDREAGREYERRYNNRNNGKDNEKQCMKHRTMVNMNQHEICFSMKPVPKCSSTCNPTGTKSRSIDFHCVQRTSTSEKVAQRVQNGANPDLSQKTVSKTETHQIPISCKA